jgi:5,6-dimethylbenzimidazole synthase
VLNDPALLDNPAALGNPRDARLYDVIQRRRDVRGEFTGAVVDEAALLRVLEAAHAAPSVGLSQPWDFIRIDSQGTRDAFWQHVQTERHAFQSSLGPEAAASFERIKIDGIREASLSLVVTYDASRGAPHVLGRHAIADAGLYSVCLAIQNLWLAATAEGWGVGWVSFYREPFLRQILSIPDEVRPVCWLCLGPVTHLNETPDLERAGWRSRRPLTDALHVDRWPSPPGPLPGPQRG